MNKCEHATSRTVADHGNAQLSECDWGCGAILITVTDSDGIAHEFTADELVALRQFVAKVDSEAQAIIDNENSHIAMYFDAMKENERLRAELSRLEEMEYALDGGNTDREVIAADVLSVWLHYVHTGKRKLKGVGQFVENGKF